MIITKKNQIIIQKCVKNTNREKRLGALATDATGQLNVLRHDRNTLSMNGAEVGVLKETREVSLRSLLKSTDSRALEAHVLLEIRCDLSNKASKRELGDEQLGTLLVAADLAEGHGSRAEAVRLLDTSVRDGVLARALSTGRLAGVRARRLASSRLAGSLLRASHGSEKVVF